MTKINRLYGASVSILLLQALYALRVKYRVSDAAIWDLFAIYIMFNKTQCGVTAFQMRMFRYGGRRGAQTIKDRRSLLVKKGLVEFNGRLSYLTPLAIKELNSLIEIPLKLNT